MNIDIKRYEIIDDNIRKELSGYRIALFSDTHNLYYGPAARDLTDIFDCEQPDIICFTGDAVRKSAKNSRPDTGFENALEVFAAIAAKYPLYYVNGNHDKRWKKRSKNLNYFSNYISALKKAGVHYLVNQSVSVANGALTITGLDLPLAYYKGSRKKIGDIERFIGKPGKESFNLLLAHSPSFFEEYSKWGSSLTLCGHTHGGIFRFPGGRGVLSPTRKLFPKMSYGLFDDGKSKMIVTSGCGDHNPRISFNNPYEVVIITLKAKEEDHGT